MKRFSILFLAAAVLAYGCGREVPSARTTPGVQQGVKVSFSLRASLDTDTSLQPMTRASGYTQVMSNLYRIVVLKKSGSRWIVDMTYMKQVDPSLNLWNDFVCSGNLLPITFDLEMRPGDYRVIAVTNPGSCTWNTELVAGKVVADSSDPDFRTLPMLTYRVSDHSWNPGYKMLSREVFVAIADFTVPKSGDLHSSPMPTVELQGQRRVGKLRIILKQGASPVKGHIFENTGHNIHMTLRTTQRPFAQGIDALGGMYYGDPGVYEMRWGLSTSGTFFPAAAGDYQVCEFYSTVFSPFLFVDPEVGEQSFEVSDITIAGSSTGYIYLCNQVFTCQLAASKITGFVLKTDDATTEQFIHTVGATDENGNPEDPTALFDQFFEWSTKI